MTSHTNFHVNSDTLGPATGDEEGTDTWERTCSALGRRQGVPEAVNAIETGAETSQRLVRPNAGWQ